MKLKDMDFIYSQTGDIQTAILWDRATGRDVVGCSSIEYLKKHHGDAEILRVQADGRDIVLTIDSERKM